MTNKIPQLALYKPEIHSNTGAILRTAACFGSLVNIIMPTGFTLFDSKFKRSVMQYIDGTEYKIWDCYKSFQDYCQQNQYRIVGTSARIGHNYTKFSFHDNDVILMGPESTGLDNQILDSIESVRIPMKNNNYSLNIGVATAVILSEAIRQIM